MFEDFIGAEACGECHFSQFQEWQGSTHGRAGGLATSHNVISTFEGQLRFQNASVNLYLDPSGQYWFEVNQPGHEVRRLRMDHVVGGGHMIGGGTQAAFSVFPDGTWRMLPFDFIKKENLWFCSTGPQGWVPITPALKIEQCQDWPPGWAEGFLGNGCQNCHGSQITLSYDPLQHRFQTQVQSLTINCESCHGPGRAHQELARSGQIQKAEDLHILSPDLLNKEGSLQVCFQCHAEKIELEPSYLPGKRLEEHYALTAPFVSSVHPDGRIAGFGYQKNHLYSNCYLQGSMTCVDCHSPHSLSYRDVSGRPLQGRFDDGQCLGCHASKADNLTSHTHHQAESPGSRCTSCHMPFLQHQALGQQLRFARSDHTIPIPRPAFDAALGLENACQICHPEQSLAAQQKQVEAWYGLMKPLPLLVQGVMQAQKGASDPELEALLGLAAREAHPQAQLQALGVITRRWTESRPWKLSVTAQSDLQKLTQVTDLDLKASALLLMDLLQESHPSFHQVLQEAQSHSNEALFKRWGAFLWGLGEVLGEQLTEAKRRILYEKSLSIWPRGANVHFSLAELERTSAHWEKALKHYQEVLRLGPETAARHGEVYYGLGKTHAGQNDWEKAAQNYAQGIHIFQEKTPILLKLCQGYRELTPYLSLQESILTICQTYLAIP